MTTRFEERDQSAERAQHSRYNERREQTSSSSSVINDTQDEFAKPRMPVHSLPLSDHSVNNDNILPVKQSSDLAPRSYESSSIGNSSVRIRQRSSSLNRDTYYPTRSYSFSNRYDTGSHERKHPRFHGPTPVDGRGRDYSAEYRNKRIRDQDYGPSYKDNAGKRRKFLPYSDTSTSSGTIDAKIGGSRFSRGYQGAQIVAAQWSEHQEFKHGNGIPQTNFNHHIFFSYLDKLARTPYIEEVKNMFSNISDNISGSRYDNMYRVCMILLSPKEYELFGPMGTMRQVIGDLVEMFYYDGSVLVILPREKPLSRYKRHLADRMQNWLERLGPLSKEQEEIRCQLLERLGMGTEMVLNYFGFTGLIGSIMLKRKNAEKPYPTHGALRHILDPFIAVFLAICDLSENIDIVQSKNTEDLVQLKNTMTKFMPHDFLSYPTVSIGAHQALSLLRALKDYLCKTEASKVIDSYNYQQTQKVTEHNKRDQNESHIQQQDSLRYEQIAQQMDMKPIKESVGSTSDVTPIESLPLPHGWEIRYDNQGRRYFVDLIQWKSQWEDPREQIRVQQQPSSADDNLKYISQHQYNKPRASTSSESSIGNAVYAQQQKQELYTVEQLKQVLQSHNFKRISHTLDHKAYDDLSKCETSRDYARIIIRLKGNWKHIFCDHRFKREYVKHNSESHTCAFAHSEEERIYWDNVRSELGIVINDR